VLLRPAFLDDDGPFRALFFPLKSSVWLGLLLANAGTSNEQHAARLRHETTRCHFVRRIYMAKGTVKWFNPAKGFGFIQPEDGGKDVFVHISAVEKAGWRTLNEGQKISYELLTEKGKTFAGNLQEAA
jgi:CspA family cold shock protein